MFTKNDLLDFIAAAIKDAPAKAPPRRKRVFLSDWELKKMRPAGGGALHVPAEAVISPLARDWLDYEGIKIIFDK